MNQRGYDEKPKGSSGNRTDSSGRRPGDGSRGRSGRRTNRRKIVRSKAVRRELGAILLATLIAAFFIITEPGKGMISTVTGSSGSPGVSAVAGTANEAQADTEEAQADTEEAQADTEEAQADTEEAQADTEEAQADTEEAQADTEEAQADTEEVQADIGEAQAGTGEAEQETEREDEPLAEVSGQNQQGPPSQEQFTLDMVPEYSGQAYADINGDVPFFTDEEMTSTAFHEYWPLDELGRCTGAFACVGPETLPKQRRGDISEVKPTGWHTDRYDGIDGEMLFNRCHLIGHMLTGQDANDRNLITGTRYMNTEGMLPFEESVLMYVEGTGHHVMYRVRPYFDGDNLVCAGVLMEARSVEDPLVQFCAFCYNVQPGIEIDYATGDNRWAMDGQDDGVFSIVSLPSEGEDAGSRQAGAEEGAESGDAEAEEMKPKDAAAEDAPQDEKSTEESEDSAEEVRYILNTNTRKFHMPYCDSVYDIKDKNKQESTQDREALIEQGYTPCKRCNP